MSKIGKQRINIPSDVLVNVQKQTLTVNGPKGSLSMQISNFIDLYVTKRYIKLEPKKITKKTRSIWGLKRSIIKNMVIGVSVGFSKKLEINGVGYKAFVDSNLLVLSLGFSHDVVYPVPINIRLDCTKNIIDVSGCDKQLVGQVCADIRNIKKPEPYKGKGIKYKNEFILRKEGKKK